MIIGPKKKLILLQQTRTSDSMGANDVVTWGEVKEIEGVMAVLSTMERQYVDDKKTVFNNYKFHIDYPKNVIITEKDRFKMKGTTRIFEITGINNPGEQNRMLTINLLEIV